MGEGLQIDEHPPFAVTVDLLVFTLSASALEVLLVKRGAAPHQGRWALPGGFVRERESLEDAARRVLHTKTGLDPDAVHLEQVQTFGAPKRDPRLRVVSVAYMAFAHERGEPQAGPSETAAAWTDVADASGRKLAFDHARILEVGLERARAKLEYSTLAVHFCEPEFTLAELRRVYEVAWDTELDAPNFARKVSAVDGFLIETGNSVKQGRGRPAKTYRAGPATIIFPPLQRPE